MEWKEIATPLNKLPCLKSGWSKTADIINSRYYFTTANLIMIIDLILKFEEKYTFTNFTIKM